MKSTRGVRACWYSSPCTRQGTRGAAGGGGNFDIGTERQSKGDEHAKGAPGGEGGRGRRVQPCVPRPLRARVPPQGTVRRRLTRGCWVGWTRGLVSFWRLGGRGDNHRHDSPSCAGVKRAAKGGWKWRDVYGQRRGNNVGGVGDRNGAMRGRPCKADGMDWQPFQGVEDSVCKVALPASVSAAHQKPRPPANDKP